MDDVSQRCEVDVDVRGDVSTIIDQALDQIEDNAEVVRRTLEALEAVEQYLLVLRQRVREESDALK